MLTSYAYDDAMLAWEGKCCNGMKYFDRDRGTEIMGTTGAVIVDRDGYEIYDLKGKKISEHKANTGETSSTDLMGRDSMTDAHFANFIAGIQKGEKLNQPVAQGNVAVTMLQLSNVAWEVNRELHLDTARWQGAERSGSDEVLGTCLRKGLGAASLNARLVRDNRLQGEDLRRDRHNMERAYMHHDLSRRNFLRSGALAATAISSFGALSAGAQVYSKAGQATPVKLGLASYTFREFTRAQLIGYMKQLNLTALNVKDVKDHLPMDPAGEAAALADYAAAGIKLHAAGAIYFREGRGR